MIFNDTVSYYDVMKCCSCNITKGTDTDRFKRWARGFKYSDLDKFFCYQRLWINVSTSGCCIENVSKHCKIIV